MSSYYALAIEDSDGERCECCGTPCPKRRVVLRSQNGGDVRYGSMCAALALRGERTQTAARQVEREAEQAEYARRDRQQRAETDAFIAFVATLSDAPSHFERLQAIGGMAEARRLYSLKEVA